VCKGADGSAQGAARRQAPRCAIKAFREALMSRYRWLKIEGGAFFYTRNTAVSRSTPPGC